MLLFSLCCLRVFPEPWCHLWLEGDHAKLPQGLQAHLELLWHPGSSFWGAQNSTRSPRCVLTQLKAFNWVIISAYSSPGLSLALGRAFRFFFFFINQQVCRSEMLWDSDGPMDPWPRPDIQHHPAVILPGAGGQGGPEPELQPIFPVSPRASQHIWWTQCAALGWWGPGHFLHFFQSSTVKWGI